MFVFTTIITIAGVLLIVIGYRLKPSLFLGFRIGYAYISRYTWRKLNIYSGISFIVLGSILYLLIFSGLTPPILLIVLPLVLVAILIGLTEYGARLAEKELIRMESIEKVEYEKLRSIEAGFIPIAIASISIPIFIYFLIMYYPLLPEKIAIHFDIKGKPDLYADKSSGLLYISLAFIVITAISLFFSYLSIKRPESFYRPIIPFTLMRRIASAINILLSILIIVILLAFVDTICYNVYRFHIVRIEFMPIVILVPLFIVIAYIVSIATKIRKIYREKLGKQIVVH